MLFYHTQMVLENKKSRKAAGLKITVMIVLMIMISVQLHVHFSSVKFPCLILALTLSQVCFLVLDLCPNICT